MLRRLTTADTCGQGVSKHLPCKVGPAHRPSRKKRERVAGLDEMLLALSHPVRVGLFFSTEVFPSNVTTPWRERHRRA